MYMFCFYVPYTYVEVCWYTRYSTVTRRTRLLPACGYCLSHVVWHVNALSLQRQSCTLTEFLSAMTRAVKKELGDRRGLEAHR